MILSKNIRFLRRQRGWSQDYIAERLGYKSYTTIQKWEMGTSEPPLKKLKELAELFQVDINDLANIDLEFPESSSESVSIFIISDAEKLHIQKYRALDEYGKRNVDSILQNEYERCSDSNIITLQESPTSYKVHTLAAHECAGATDEDKQHDYDLLEKIKKDGRGGKLE